MIPASLILASMGFLLIHFVSATNIREIMVSLWGANAWMVIFSLLSLGFFSWMVYEYMQIVPFDRLWYVPQWYLWVNAVLMFVALFFIVMGNVPDSDARLGKGIFAITRHPSNWGVAIFAATHMVTNGSFEAVLFWGSIMGAGIIGSFFLDKRLTAIGGKERWVKSLENSSWLPFWAIVKGRTKLNFDDFKPLPVMLCVAVFFVAAIVHVGAFGTYLLPL